MTTTAEARTWAKEQEPIAPETARIVTSLADQLDAMEKDLLLVRSERDLLEGWKEGAEQAAESARKEIAGRDSQIAMMQGWVDRTEAMRDAALARAEAAEAEAKRLREAIEAHRVAADREGVEWAPDRTLYAALAPPPAASDGKKEE